MLTRHGQDMTWDEIHVGIRSIFRRRRVLRSGPASKRRVVMRIDF